MQVQKNDFVEIEFTGTSNGEVFDTTDKEKAKQMGLDAEVKPIIISVGQEMVLKGLDEELISKEIGEKYSVHLLPKKAFGKRDPNLVKTIPMRVFREKNIAPQAGMTFQMDNYMVRILSVSGGRVMGDFNNPLAGKEVDYDFKILRKINEDKDKIESLQDYFFKKRFDFQIKEKKVIFSDPNLAPLIQMFANKFKEMTGYEFVVETKKQEKKSNKEKTDKKQ